MTTMKGLPGSPQNPTKLNGELRQDAEPAPKKRAPSKKPTAVEPKRTSKPAQEIKNEKVELTVETPEPNQYAPKPKVGTPTLGRSPNYVTTVGLGNLKVTTVNGRTNVQS